MSVPSEAISGKITSTTVPSESREGHALSCTITGPTLALVCACLQMQAGGGS